jgi:hypothetical protein
MRDWLQAEKPTKGCLETAADARRKNYRDTAAVSDGANVSTRPY